MAFLGYFWLLVYILDYFSLFLSYISVNGEIVL